MKNKETLLLKRIRIFIEFSLNKMRLLLFNNISYPIFIIIVI